MSSPPECWLIWYLKFSFLYYSCCHAKANFVVDTFEIVKVFLVFSFLIFISGNIWSWKWSHTNSASILKPYTEKVVYYLSFLLTVCGAIYIFTWGVGEMLVPGRSWRWIILSSYVLCIWFTCKGLYLSLVLGSSLCWGLLTNVQTVERSKHHVNCLC